MKAVAGSAVGSAIIALISFFINTEQLTLWGWLTPFLLGGLFGFIGLFQRLHSEETQAYQKLSPTKKVPFFKHFRQLPYSPLLMTMVLSAIMSIGFYLFIAYFNTFLLHTLKKSPQIVMSATFVGQLVLTLAIPCFGILSDKMGRKPVWIIGILGTLACVHPVFWLLQQSNSLSIFLGESLFALCFSPIIALIPTTLSEMFPAHTRNSSVSLGYSISQAIFGGTTPLVAITLTARMNNLYAPAWYLFAVSVVALCFVFTLKETSRENLE